MTTLEKLREGYVRDLIELDVFEEFVGAVLEGRPVALPYALQALSSGPPHAFNVASVLKETWSDDRVARGQYYSGARLAA